MGLFDKPGNEQEHTGGGLRQIFEAAKPALNLSAEQEQKIKEIFKEFREERNDLRDAAGNNMRDDIRAVRKETKQQLMDVLNDDQKEIIQKHLRERRDKDS